MKKQSMEPLVRVLDLNRLLVQLEELPTGGGSVLHRIAGDSAEAHTRLFAATAEAIQRRGGTWRLLLNGHPVEPSSVFGAAALPARKSPFSEILNSRLPGETWDPAEPLMSLEEPF